MRGEQLLLMHAVFSSLRNSISGMGHIKNSKRGVAYKIRRQNFPRLNDVFNCTYSFGCTSACACITLYNTLKQFCSKKGRSKKSKPTGQGEKQQNSTNIFCLQHVRVANLEYFEDHKLPDNQIVSNKNPSDFSTNISVGSERGANIKITRQKKGV